MHNNLVEFLNSLLIIDPKEDSYDISIWPTLSDSDQNIAKSRLIEQATNGNPKALITLGNLQLTETLKIIKAHTNNKDEWVRFCANRALIKLTGVYDGLLDDASSKSETTRFGALLELTKINDVTVENKIIDALYDKDNLVRSKALEALIHRHKLEEYITDKNGDIILESPLKTLGILLGSKTRTLWLKAAFSAKEIFQEINKGTQLKDLDIKYSPSKQHNFRVTFRDAYFDEKKVFNLDIVNQVSGHDRYWAEAFLAIKLKPTENCSRAITALSYLKAYWVIPTLELLLTQLNTTDTLFEITEKAISQLNKPLF